MNEREQLIKQAQEKWEREQLISQARAKWEKENSGGVREGSPEDRVNKGGMIAAALRKGAQGFYGGGYDELAGALETVPNMVKDGKGVGESYREGRDYYRDVQDETEKQYPITSKVAELVGSVVGPGKYMKGLKSTVAVGGLMGLLGSKADLTKGNILPAAVDAAEAAALGGVGYGLAKGAEKVFKKGVGLVAPKLRGGVERVIGKAEKRADAEDLMNALKKVSPDIENVPPYLLTQPGSQQQKIAGHLMKSPTVGGQYVRDEMKPVFKGLDAFANDVSDAASVNSLFDSGKMVKGGIQKRFSEMIEPAEKAYEALESKFAKTPLNYLGLKRGLNLLKKEYKNDFTGSAQKLINQIESTVLPQIDDAGNPVGGLTSVADLKDFRTKMGKFLGGNPSDTEREIINRMYGVLTRERDRSILARSVQGGSKIGRSVRAKGLLNEIKNADKTYKDAIKNTSDALGIKSSRRNAQSGLIRDYLEKTPNEQLVKDLFTKNDAAKLNSLKQNFPAEFDELRRQSLSEIVSKATHNGVLSPQKLSTALAKLPKESKELMLGSLKDRAEAVEMVLGAIPSLNPSDTATKLEIAKLFNVFRPLSALEGWANNATSVFQRRAIGDAAFSMPEGPLKKVGKGLLRGADLKKSLPLGLIQSNQDR